MGVVGIGDCGIVDHGGIGGDRCDCVDDQKPSRSSSPASLMRRDTDWNWQVPKWPRAMNTRTISNLK